ncbi:ABC transporter ATP-binding protein [Isobaculum melis]|uniref:Putative ABC transport system ATP-binding protein n=1 Tax=Isobaculum melis TaxID=142588 RepID=A0A1H9TBE0_9LACT|nr:ABC transporter ATP-binding protein [Isobaculum melis]SER93933.1 putative ABC transport system ATP-binding protein [Isobaculum melis]
MNVIVFENVSKKFGNYFVLKNLNLSIRKGEFVSIVGPSGSGKTTILNIMGLLDTFNAGNVSINGQSLPKLNSRPAEKIRRETINYLFQSFALIEDKTVYDNLKLSLHFSKGINKDQVIKQVLTDVHLDNKLNKLVNTLSSGEKQRIALARVMIKPGNIILADEPTGALDPELAQQAFDLILKMQKESGKTIVMVTHNMEQAQQTDRMIKLKSEV